MSRSTRSRSCLLYYATVTSVHGLFAQCNSRTNFRFVCRSREIDTAGSRKSSPGPLGIRHSNPDFKLTSSCSLFPVHFPHVMSQNGRRDNNRSLLWGFLLSRTNGREFIGASNHPNFPRSQARVTADLLHAWQGLHRMLHALFAPHRYLM